MSTSETSTEERKTTGSAAGRSAAARRCFGRQRQIA